MTGILVFLGGNPDQFVKRTNDALKRAGILSQVIRLEIAQPKH